MIRIYDLKEISVAEVLRRENDDFGNVDEVVRNIILEVKNRGDKALKDYSLRFDGVELSDIEVGASDIDAAYNSLDRALIDVFLDARKNIVAFHKNQLRTGFEYCPKKGILLGQKITPIERVGIYVPGGTAGYPSTVFMNALPARIAGVKEIIMVTPPAKDGTIRKEILAAAKIAGVDRVFMAGGAQAIAALAFGTESIPK
jgi:Histidinol dehydrogenase